MTTMTCSKTKASTCADDRKPFMPILTLLYLVALPQLAWAEGAVRVLDCKVTQVCDASGACEAESDDVSFRLAPENLHEDGSGTYAITYRAIQASMEATSEAGPFYWTMGSERNTLLASSETQFLWHRLMLDPTPATRVYFLNCALQ